LRRLRIGGRIELSERLYEFEIVDVGDRIVSGMGLEGGNGVF
jgi:hypothetical protein